MYYTYDKEHSYMKRECNKDTLYILPKSISRDGAKDMKRCHELTEYNERKCVYNARCSEVQYLTNMISVELAGTSVFEYLIQHPKVTYGDLDSVIRNEGGFIDENGIIQQGTAERRLVTLQV